VTTRRGVRFRPLPEGPFSGAVHSGYSKARWIRAGRRRGLPGDRWHAGSCRLASHVDGRS
jgi:hypothetical protein